MDRPTYQEKRFWAVAISIFFLILSIKYFKNSLYSHNGPAQPVVLAVAASRDVPVYLSALGAVTPTYTVTVKTQINGRLMRVLFKEGQNVTQGQLIAEIDSRPYVAQLMQYQGQLTHDRALLENAKLDLKRYQTLYHQDSIAKQVLDTQVALVKQDEGTVAFDEGQIDAVRVNLTYCYIVSPINGRVGLRLVDEGNFVQTTDPNGLVVINTLSPITVIFTLPEDDIPEVVKKIHEGKILSVEAYDRSQIHLLEMGTLITIDNQVDPTTGTVKLRAEFQNKTDQLFPSQFVNVKLLVDLLHNATVVPTGAVQYGRQGPFVYVLSDHHRVKMTAVVTGVTTNDNTVITSGITPGQSVVVEGADKLTDGAAVRATS